MRVLLDTSYAARGYSGTAVYIERLAEALRRREGIELVEAGQPRRLRRGGRNPLRSAVNAGLDLAWLQSGLPQAARAAKADLVHHPLPAFSSRIPVPQVATVHDLTPLRRPEDYGRVWRTLARRGYRTAFAGCGALVCVSRAVADEVPAPRERVIVAPHGPGQELPRRMRGEPRHFLYVGDDEPRKNVDGLLSAYESYRRDAERPLELVLAGAAARRTNGQTEASPERLAELHASAAALVHPSLEEGFGLTLLEAMAVGTPVVAVKNPAVEEICAESALLVDPGDLAGAMSRVAEDAVLRDRLADSGRERVSAFSWEESARLHEAAYTLAVK